MTYQAPVDDIMHALKTAAGLDGLIADGVLGGVDEETIRAIIAEAGKFGAEVLEPLDALGDRTGSKLVDGKVVTPPGWKEAYAQYVAGGWNGLGAPEKWGGQHLPQVVATAAAEIWDSANLAFGLCPLLTHGAIDALEAQGSEELKRTYLPRMVSGEWTGTMNLTEPHAGSDLGQLKTRAERHPDGSYRIFGTKIFITYGDHEMTDNIVHLVLARLPDAPPGTRGISLFLVPKYLVNKDGSLGARNDVVCAGRRAQARHPCEPHLRDEVRREGRRRRLPRGRGEPRPQRHVHHDERRAPGGRACRAWRWPSAPPSAHSPMRASAGRAAAPPPGAPTWRPSSSTPTSAAACSP